jgi:hypothetical protein
MAVIIVPIIANVLLFVPWGFLMFIALYTVNRPTLQTYVLTVLLGFTFTCAIEGWQYFLPDRVADINDIIWNTTGAFSAPSSATCARGCVSSLRDRGVATHLAFRDPSPSFGASLASRITREHARMTPRYYGISSTFPVVSRASSARCASAASRKRTS